MSKPLQIETLEDLASGKFTIGDIIEDTEQFLEGVDPEDVPEAITNGPRNNPSYGPHPILVTAENLKFPHNTFGRYPPFQGKTLFIPFETEIELKIPRLEVTDRLVGTVCIKYGICGRDTDSPNLPKLEDKDRGVRTLEGLYNVSVGFSSVEYSWDLGIPLTQQGNSWHDFAICRSSHGLVYAEGKPMGGLRYARFRSKRYEVVSSQIPELKKVWVSDDVFGPRSKSGFRNRIPDALPAEFALDCDKLNSGVEHLICTGFRFRAADIDWGADETRAGEFVQLVRHLGLGTTENPKYTFEPMEPDNFDVQEYLE